MFANTANLSLLKMFICRNIVSGCPVLAPNQYARQHNNGLKVLYYHLRFVCCLGIIPMIFHPCVRMTIITGEFLWSGERPIDDDVQCFPGGH